MPEKRKKSINSLDFLIITVLILTVCAFIFKGQISTLFVKGGPVEDVKITAVHNFKTEEEAASAFKKGDKLFFTHNVFFADVSEVEVNVLEGNQGYEVKLTLFSQAQKAQKGYTFSDSVTVSSGDRCEILCSDTQYGIDILEIISI